MTVEITGWQLLTVERDEILAWVGQLPAEDARGLLFAAVMGLREYNGLAERRIDFCGTPLYITTARAWSGMAKDIARMVAQAGGVS